MKVEYRSYRFAKEILQHKNFIKAWEEINTILTTAPLFIYPGKSSKNKKLDVVQQVLNTYFDRKFAIDHGWKYHPLATNIEDSDLKADFRKKFGSLAIQAEVQFGNMSRWYSDIFKFQTAYSQGLIQMGLSIVPMADLASRIDSNVVNFERAWRELPSAELSIILPIILVGLSPDKHTTIIDISKSRFSSVKDITGKGKTENRWRIVNGYLQSIPMTKIDSNSPAGPMPAIEPESQETDDID
jgi:hypothetical protein